MKERQQKPTNITKMDNQYVRSIEQRKAAQRKASFYVKRRMLLLCIAAVLIFGGLIINIFDKKKEPLFSVCVVSGQQSAFSV